MVEIRIWGRTIDIESSWTFHCYGSTPEAATQSAACHALLRIRMEAGLMHDSDFCYYPARIEGCPIPGITPSDPRDSPRCIRTARLATALETAYRLTEYELHATRRRLGLALAVLEPACDAWLTAGREILHGPFDPVPADWTFPQLDGSPIPNVVRAPCRRGRFRQYVPRLLVPVLMGRDRVPFPYPPVLISDNPDVYVDGRPSEEPYAM